MRIPVLNPDGSPAMPTKRTRAETWVHSGKAKWVKTKLRVKAVQLIAEPSGRNTQPIVVGIDPGKLHSGIACISQRQTLFLGHLELPFKRVRKRMDDRRMMRRGRRGRRINRKIAFNLRAHRQKRFDNRRQGKLAPSIKANRDLEIRVTKELCTLYPVTSIVFEYVKADVDLTSGRKKARSGKGFSAVMVGQTYALRELARLALVKKLFGWQTAQIRRELGLVKSKDKTLQSPESHAVDGIALAASEFISYQRVGNDSMQWVGSVNITPSTFEVIARPAFSRRQLHLMLPREGGLRRKYGGSKIQHHDLKKGDIVKAEKAGVTYIGYVSGDTKTAVSVSDSNWKRFGRFTASKIQLLYRSVGLLVGQPHCVSVLNASSIAA